MKACTHPRGLKEFTFSDGQRIEMCDDCPIGGIARRALLAKNNIPAWRAWQHKLEDEAGYSTVPSEEKIEITLEVSVITRGDRRDEDEVDVPMEEVCQNQN
jgi:hypothetical protein